MSTASGAKASTASSNTPMSRLVTCPPVAIQAPDALTTATLSTAAPPVETTSRRPDSARQ